MQLSWPRDGDKKRAMISRSTRRELNDLRSNVTKFLNASSWDVSLSKELEKGTTSGEKHLRWPVKLPNADSSCLQPVIFIQ